MTSVVPVIIDRLLEVLTPELDPIRVADGNTPTGDPGDYLVIGAEDPDARGFEVAADSTQAYVYAGSTIRLQTGDITCQAMSWNGDADQKAARTAVYAITAAVDEYLRANPDLGLRVEGDPRTLQVEYGTRETLSQATADFGAAALVVFSVHFESRQ